MLNQQRKKFKSHEKDQYFRKTSPNNQNNKSINEANSFKKFLGGTITPKRQQTSQNNEKSKQFSFLRFIPSTTKNALQRSQQGQKNTKQIKIPSFFKKFSNKKQQNSQLDNSQSKQRKLFSSARQTPSEKIALQQPLKSNNDIKNSTNLNESCNNNEMSDYNKLNNKINYLLNKINQMKATLDKKRKQKLVFMQLQRTERASTVGSDEDTSSCSNTETPLKKFITQVPQHKDLHTFTQNPYSPRHSTYYVSQILRAYREEKSLAREHILSSIEYLRMFHHTKIPDEKQIAHMKVNLQRPKGYEDKKTIVFDLDETLIHCNENKYLPSDFKIKINFPTGEIIQVGINVRPFARQILAALSKKFQIIVFTASHSCYANVVLDNLDPEHKYIHHRLFRQSCYCTPEGIYVKDLRIINRSLAKMILVDNAAYSYAYQPLNGVPIIPYYEGKNDYELQALQKYTENLVFTVDVREKNKNTFKLDRYHQFDDLNSLVQLLYNPSHP